MTTWHFLPEPNIPPDLLNFVGDPLLAQLLVQRNLTTVEQARAFLDPQAYTPSPPPTLPDMVLAVTRLQQAIEQQERICVWGDFDVDGQTATALLVSTLQSLGASVRFYIPDRLTESHGLKLSALHRILAEGVKLILTCDTGIDAHEAVAAAQAAGVEVIITDHHDLPADLPPAQAVINPKRLPEGHPLRELPGVGVAYKVAEALYEAYARPSESESLLDLVALGIVADVAHQTGDTRYLLQKGLEVLPHTQRLGLQALLESARTRSEAKQLTEDHIGYDLAPRLNALGRLGDANLAVELLTTANRTRARIIALQLEALNERRKLLVDRTMVQALSQIEEAPSLAERNVLVLSAAEWHPGIIGIAASRLAHRFGKPAVLIALRPDGMGHGSARSVPGCDIHQALKTQAQLLTRFGGHPMAAGLTLVPENIAALRRGLAEALVDCGQATAQTLTIDATVDLPQISSALLATLQRLAPFGPGNPPVHLACRGLRVVEEAVFGKTRANKRLTVADEAGHQQEVIWWRGAAERTPPGSFDLAFTLSPNDYPRSGVPLRVTWLAANLWEAAATATPVEFIDWRQMTNYKLLITNLLSPIIWAEAVALPNFSTVTRQHLQPAETLVLWSVPPGPDIFQQIIGAVHPQKIYLIGQPSPFDTFPNFIKQLLGLIKHALSHKAGEVDVEAVAAALGQRVPTVQLGIKWLVAQGKLTIYVDEEALLVLRPAQHPATEAVATIEELLQAALTETAAYRRFFKEARLAALQKMVQERDA